MSPQPVGVQPAPGIADYNPMMPQVQAPPVQPASQQSASGPFPQQAATPNQPSQSSDEKKTQTNQSTTQKSLLFSEIRDNMAIMADGSFRAVIACQSINFDLMSNREREGVEYSYQNFLNSLNFDTQILIQSRRVDIAPYLEKLEGIRRSQDNMLLGVLMDDYIGFIDTLAQEANIMEKSFYIVVPYSSNITPDKLVEKSRGFVGNFFGQFLPKPTATVTKIDDATYQKAREEINNRVNAVMSGLFQIGVQCAQLTTKELGELYYNSYNPDTAVNQPLGDFGASAALYVRKGEGQAPRASLQEGSM